MTKKPKNHIGGAGDTPEYREAKCLLTERKMLQARLTEVNRALRQLQNQKPGAVSEARARLEEEQAAQAHLETLGQLLEELHLPPRNNSSMS